jgi:very-short-patch-repair endonuclease
MPAKPRRLTLTILDRARGMRHNATPPEQLLWSVLRDRRLGGLKFRRQEPIGPYIVDFCCAERRLVVEVDGSSHEEKLESDAVRTRWLTNQGYRALRVTNQDVTANLEAVARYIAREAGIAWDDQRAPSPPAPLPRAGEGSL